MGYGHLAPVAPILSHLSIARCLRGEKPDCEAERQMNGDLRTGSAVVRDIGLIRNGAEGDPSPSTGTTGARFIGTLGRTFERTSP